jgi:hypothetical protein
MPSTDIEGKRAKTNAGNSFYVHGGHSDVRYLAKRPPA